MVWFYHDNSYAGNLHDKALSIPLWSDFIILSFHEFRQLKELLSIPLWSDFIPRLLLQRPCTPLSFNPTMVWFYPSTILCFSSADSPPFNPTMVWFYHYTLEQREWTSSPHFQSHYGLILSRAHNTRSDLQKTLSIPLWSDFIRGYSCSVSQETSRLSIPLWSDFINIVISYRWCGMETFNPTMVWFYQAILYFPTTKTLSLSIPLWSDFIYTKSHRLANCVVWLSIPLWSDFIDETELRKEIEKTSFQSHYGLILSFTELMNEPLTANLSIPLWSDFIIYPLLHSR